MSKFGDAMCIRGRRPSSVLRAWRVLQGLPRMFVPSQVILLSVLLGRTMGVRGPVVQFGGLLVVFVMGSVVIASRHC
jgi:hypothetical protein